MTGRNKKRKFPQNTSIRYTIFIYFTISAFVTIVLIGVSLYSRLSAQLSLTIQEENQSLINQVNRSVNTHLRTVMRLSDSLYYGVIKNRDLSDHAVQNELALLYDNHKEQIDNIAVFSREGELLLAVPAARIKSNVDVAGEDWFTAALEKTDNIHFAVPQVQYIFDHHDAQYRWVISLSRAVEITQGTATTQGVLLIDLKYSSLEQLLNPVSLGNQGYLYLLSNTGELIYHPKMQLLDAGLANENLRTAVELKDGMYSEVFQQTKRNVIIKSVGYTGWKIIGVTPEKGIALNNVKTRLFLVFLILFFAFILMIINAYISSRITNPVKELEKAVKALEAGAMDIPIDISGSYEIEHLGRSIERMAKQIQVLMNDIVVEHESKRRSEFDTLQSQINPHFLYNTLDIIVWMIENEQQSEAVKVVTALARLFRISLSRGRSIITLADELEHVRNYLMIQQMRFKNKFSYRIEAEPETLELASLKLMLQPLVENAIYHGMEFMDGDGEILIEVFRKDQDLLIEITDNGLGMTRNRVDALLTGSKQVDSQRGSGIGVWNVKERIHLYFGSEYGLAINSEPDEGTTVQIHLPCLAYQDVLNREGKANGF